MQQLGAARQNFDHPAMMGTVPPAGTPTPDQPVPTSPARALLYILLSVLLTLATYTCVKATMVLYDFYLILQWLGGLAA